MSSWDAEINSLINQNIKFRECITADLSGQEARLWRGFLESIAWPPCGEPVSRLAPGCSRQAARLAAVPQRFNRCGSARCEDAANAADA
jgi:hypothetical protein